MFEMFILMPTLLRADCTTVACALLVGSSSVEVMAVKVKPAGLPAFLRYDLARLRLGLAHTAETGCEANGPRGTGPTTLPAPNTESFTTVWRLMAQDMASRLSALASGPVLSWSIKAR